MNGCVYPDEIQKMLTHDDCMTCEYRDKCGQSHHSKLLSVIDELDIKDICTLYFNTSNICAECSIEHAVMCKDCFAQDPKNDADLSILHKIYERCPDCEGVGWVAKLYPQGHTEETCQTCEGEGYIDKKETLNNA